MTTIILITNVAVTYNDDYIHDHTKLAILDGFVQLYIYSILFLVASQ